MTWLRITPADGTGKSGRWTVRTRDGGILLGRVTWFTPWRRYVFTAEPQVFFEKGGLTELAEFMARETQARRYPTDATLERAG